MWDAGVVMAKYMEFNPSLFSGTACYNQIVLELGSGCGLTGLAFVMKGAKVVMTDLECVINALTRPNVTVSQSVLSHC